MPLLECIEKISPRNCESPGRKVRDLETYLRLNFLSRTLGVNKNCYVDKAYFNRIDFTMGMYFVFRLNCLERVEKTSI